MILLPRGLKVHLALGYTDMRKGIDGLAMLVQGVLRQDPFSGHLFVFRGRKADLIKVLFWDGTGLCLFTKRLEHGRFAWPATPTVSTKDLLQFSRDFLIDYFNQRRQAATPARAGANRALPAALTAALP